jgi:hypothetical protein
LRTTRASRSRSTLPQVLKFVFPRADLVWDTYDGSTASLRYFVRVTIARSSYASGALSKELDIVVQNPGQVRSPV